MTMPYNVLIIDDEAVMRDSCYQILARHGCEVQLASNGAEGIELFRRCQYDVVILDLKLPDMNGFDVLGRMHEENPEASVIIITGYSTVDNAVKGMKLGAYDFIPKPFTPNMLRSIVVKAFEKKRSAAGNDSRAAGLDGNAPGVLDSIIGESRTIADLKRLIRKAAASECPVLITGETGTGKELTAHALHDCSPRRAARFVTVDAGGLSDTLVESELFGHVKGSFTGAYCDRAGRFELADKGTLFLDEISNMNYPVQRKLLRALQEYEITRVGSSNPIQIDVRVVAASNRDLMDEIQAARFRHDLYYRLNVISIHLRPLRERREDIPLLAQHFLDWHVRKKAAPLPNRISDAGMNRLLEYDWPGNIRELENIMARAGALCEREVVDPFEVSNELAVRDTRSLHVRTGSSRLEDLERMHIANVLKSCRFNKSGAARMLGIDRKTLRNKIRQYHLM